jgi:hypothetical protein
MAIRPNVTSNCGATDASFIHIPEYSIEDGLQNTANHLFHIILSWLTDPGSKRCFPYPITRYHPINYPLCTVSRLLHDLLTVLVVGNNA